MADEFSRGSIRRRLKLVRLAATELYAPEMIQAAYAARVGVAASTYNNYERRDQRIPHELVTRIHLLFGFDANYIYNGDLSGLSIQRIEAIQRAERRLIEEEKSEMSRSKGKNPRQKKAKLEVNNRKF
jgi:transcriptional regulator with XRE-family HTH domain